MKIPPRTASNECRAHSCLMGGNHIVIQPVTHIQDGAGRNLGFVGHSQKKPAIQFGDTPRLGGGNEIGLQSGRMQCSLDARGLIAGNPDDQPSATRRRHTLNSIWVKVMMIDFNAPIGPIHADQVPHNAEWSGKG